MATKTDQIALRPDRSDGAFARGDQKSIQPPNLGRRCKSPNEGLGNKRRGPTFTSNFWSVVIGLSVAALAAVPFRADPVALINLTPSEPMGLYVRDLRLPAIGDVVAFKPPRIAKAFEDRRGQRLTTFLKTIAAMSGDHVCVVDQQLLINGAARGLLARQDRSGTLLPQWRECRRLAPKEMFVFSNRVPNSFDSRYFGPIEAADVVGVFRPALLLAAAGR